MAQSRPNKPKQNKNESRVSVRIPYFPAASGPRVVLGAAGGLCAALDAASVALADAGIPMRDLVCACAS